MQTLEELKKRVEELIYPERLEAWNTTYKSSEEDPDFAIILKSAVDVMEALEQGKTIEESVNKGYLAKQLNNSANSSMMSIVGNYSKRGPDFILKCQPWLEDWAIEHFLKLKEKNSAYETAKEEKSNCQITIKSLGCEHNFSNKQDGHTL